MKGRCWTNEAREKLKNSRIHQWDDHEKKLKMTSKLKLLHSDPLLRSAHSRKIRAWWNSPEGQAKKKELANPTPEMRLLLSANGRAQKGRVKSKLECSNISKALKNKPFSEKHIENIRIAQRQRREKERTLFIASL